MNADNFADFIENPSLLYQITYQDLKELTVRYPYSANLRLLLTKKCKMEGRKDFEKQLHLAATYSLNRNHLFEQFNSEDEKTDDGNYYIAEDYLQLSGLSTPSESAPPAAESNILQQGNIEFVEPQVEEIPLAIDLGTSDEEPEATSEAVSDTQIPLKDLAKMDDHKKDASRKNEDPPKKNIFFIEDLIPAKKEELPQPPPTKQPVEESPQSPPAQSSEKAPPPPPVSEPIAEPQDLQLEITEASRPVEEEEAKEELKEKPIAPAPKQSFTSWRSKAKGPRMPIRFDPDLLNKEEKPATPAPSKKKKKEAPKAFAAKSFALHEDLASETLAKLHVKQQNYEEAIRMYERLCLIFPKKRTFFAEQIEKLKNL